MKRIWNLCFAAMILTLCFATTGAAYEMNYDTIPDWQISIASPAESETVLNTEEGNYYIYTLYSGSIPYVMVKPVWGYDSEEEFVYERFLDSMAESFEDMTVLTSLEPVSIRGVDCYEIDLTYTVQGYTILDRRIFRTVGDITYMFASKEVGELDQTVGMVLEDVISESVFLAEPSSPVTTKDTFVTRSSADTGSSNTSAKTVQDPRFFFWDYDSDGTEEAVTISFTDNGDAYHSYSYIVITETDGSILDAYLDHAPEVIGAQIATNPDGSTYLVVETGKDSFGQGGDFYALRFADGFLQVTAG